MRHVLISLFALVMAASLVTLANATMTTVMPLRLLEDGASDALIALFGAAFFAGFAVGCFSEPARILRVGYIRAFAAAAAICTTLAIVMDMTDSPALWIGLRFFMGVCVAAIFASVDGWINKATPKEMRGTVYSAYGWCIGAAAVAGQFMLTVSDGLAPGFITILALAFNVAVALVTLTRANAPATAPTPVSEADGIPTAGALVVTSWTAILAAAYTGLVVTAILATLPAILSQGGVSEAVVGLVIGSYFIGRLLLQIPIGVIADRVDLRAMIAVVAALTGVVAVLAWFLIVIDVAQIIDEAGPVNRFAFLAVAALLGGITLPVYTLAVSLSFARATGEPPVRIATTLLLANSAGAVAGPMIVAALLPGLGWSALVWVILATSIAMAAFALASRVRSRALGPSVTPIVDVPATSLEITETVAAVQAEAQEAAETAADHGGARGA